MFDQAHNISFRTKDRIQELGEVYTPASTISEMLNLVANIEGNTWNNPNITFFEPSCGHGNIALKIYERRLFSIYKACAETEPAFYAVANGLNTLWAIDIDFKNVQSCRNRILRTTLLFLRQEIGSDFIPLLLNEKKKFLAHVFCAIERQIHTNETLSSLLSNQQIKNRLNKLPLITRTWFENNLNKKSTLNFELSWCNYYLAYYNSKKSEPAAYRRALRAINHISKQKNVKEEEFIEKIIYFFEKHFVARKEIVLSHARIH